MADPEQIPYYFFEYDRPPGPSGRARKPARTTWRMTIEDAAARDPGFRHGAGDRGISPEVGRRHQGLRASPPRNRAGALGQRWLEGEGGEVGGWIHLFWW